MPVDTQHQRGRAPRGAAGFTLIEVLVVIVILGLSIALVVSRGPARSVGLDIEGAAGSIAQNLRLARSQAISTDRLVAFTLDPTGRVPIVDGTPGATLAPDVRVTIMTATGGSVRSQPAITFAPDGSSSGGRVILGAGARHLQVLVDWLTGRVNVTDAP
ncbi:GspH/FimT family pseudopilin [Acidisoma cladoniae]|uniref:GspH/FimT family pseudopilin n=1 Tax=Acidisoma cladoniae TaxID=3040935 RepID=UPI00254C47AC|nr:GspH/FimT family pseudopilin [Acidisoma sp. PAMC 29798]